MNRRQFFGRVLGPIAAAVAVPELARTIFLPPRGGWPSLDRSRYLTSNTAWFIKQNPTDEDLVFFHRNPLDAGLLTEKSLEELMVATKRWADARGKMLSYLPTRLIVHPSWTPEQVEERLARML